MHPNPHPAYLPLVGSGELVRRAAAAAKGLTCCRFCPRRCEVNRLEDRTGVCHAGRLARVASFFAHFGEENCLRGWRGSGTIFFSGCNLGCVFCQNWDISHEGDGCLVAAPQLAEMMLKLQAAGCHNINWKGVSSHNRQLEFDSGGPFTVESHLWPDRCVWSFLAPSTT